MTALQVRSRVRRPVGLAALVVLLTSCSVGPVASDPPSALPGTGGARASAFPSSGGQASSPSGVPADAAARDVAAALARLPVRPRGERTGYDRDLFGPAWADTDRNGCDTRNDVLRRDLREIEVRPGTRDCVVVAGVLEDPYSGRELRFAKAQASAVQIDHVVSLSDAWQTGARAWSPERRLAFANDPLNLLAVDGGMNDAKRDSDAASWLPPHRPGRCAMVATQVAVKEKWGLWVKPAERDAVLRVLSDCPGQELPTGGAAVPPAAASPGAASPGAASPGLDLDHGSCRAAAAAGDGPYVRGVDPEYGWYTDGDADGTVCE